MKLILCGILSVLIGGVGIWGILSNLRIHDALQMWPTVKGRVIERGTTGYVRRNYEAMVRYTYEVGGKEFTGDRVYPRRMGPIRFSTREVAQKRANAFVEDTVEVHYNPADPAEAYLALRSAQQMRWMAVVCIVPLLVGILLLVYAAARSYLVRYTLAANASSKGGCDPAAVSFPLRCDVILPPHEK